MCCFLGYTEVLACGSFSHLENGSELSYFQSPNEQHADNNSTSLGGIQHNAFSFQKYILPGIKLALCAPLLCL